MPAFCCFCGPDRRRALVDAGWSSPVARQAHNLKVVGSNPTPATSNPFDSHEKVSPGGNLEAAPVTICKHTGSRLIVIS